LSCFAMVTDCAIMGLSHGARSRSIQSVNTHPADSGARCALRWY
jgi:hypothetical protein